MKPGGNEPGEDKIEPGGDKIQLSEDAIKPWGNEPGDGKIELGGKSKKRRRPCFVAQLQSKQGGRGRNVMLGRYETPVEAAVAYARAVERRREASPTPFK